MRESISKPCVNLNTSYMTEFHLPPKYTQFKCSDKELVKIGFFFLSWKKDYLKFKLIKSEILLIETLPCTLLLFEILSKILFFYIVTNWQLLNLSSGARHAYNPSYLGGRVPVNLCSRPAPAKKLTRLHLNK
jgi:hypothetical protein